MPTQAKVIRVLGLCPINVRTKVYVEYCTHLAIVFGCVVEINQDKNYDREAGQARSRVNLSRGWPDGFRLGELEVRPFCHVPISSTDRAVVVG